MSIASSLDFIDSTPEKNLLDLLSDTMKEYEENPEDPIAERGLMQAMNFVQLKIILKRTPKEVVKDSMAKTKQAYALSNMMSSN